jgi:hypothetical protein
VENVDKYLPLKEIQGTTTLKVVNRPVDKVVDNYLACGNNIFN